MATESRTEKHEHGLKLFGTRGSAKAYALRDFLQRSDIPFEWNELTSDAQAARQAQVSSLQDSRLPVCLKMGDSWIHLRLCLECGHVGCCDSSKNKHATKHFHHTHHPIVKSLAPGENWGWCYVDQLELDFA